MRLWTNWKHAAPRWESGRDTIAPELHRRWKTDTNLATMTSVSLDLQCRGPDSNRHGRYRPTDFKSVVSTIPPPRQEWKINGLGNVSGSYSTFWDTCGTLDLPFRVLLV